jgi:hypothetical protein
MDVVAGSEDEETEEEEPYEAIRKSAEKREFVQASLLLFMC